MICQKCKQKPANVHITQYANGVKQEFHFCEDCAGSLNINPGLPKTPLHNLNNIMSFLTQLGASDQRTPELTCPHCHTPYGRIAEAGYVGCSECYRYFSTQLEPLLKKIHGTTEHRGKIPVRMGKTFLIHREIEDLRRNLKEAVEKEEYEEAARIRDRVKALEDESKAGEDRD